MKLFRHSLRFIAFIVCFLQSGFSQTGTVSSGSSTTTDTPDYETDRLFMSYINEWGDDIIKLKATATAEDFETISNSLRLSSTELKLIEAIKNKANGNWWSKLIVAYPRAKAGLGVGLAAKSYLDRLGAARPGSTKSIQDAIVELGDDPIAEARAILMDLFVKVPGAKKDIQDFTFKSLKDRSLGVSPLALSAAGKKKYLLMLHQAWLNTLPSPQQAKELSAALLNSLTGDDLKIMQDRITGYTEYSEIYLICDNSGCKERAEKDDVCSTSSPCIVGLQCHKGKCIDLGKSGDRCGTGYPACHWSFACSGTDQDIIRTCIPRAKKGESCKQKPCDLGLSCVKRVGICVETAGENEACAGISLPCRDGSTLACVGGYCRKKGSRNDPCSAEKGCLKDFYCDFQNGSKCADKAQPGKPCGPDIPCIDGYNCPMVLGVPNAPAPVCKIMVGFGKECGGSAFCDNSQGLVCGSANTCREPAPSGDPCGDYRDCDTGLYCLPQTPRAGNSSGPNVCRGPGGQSSSCENDSHCQPEFQCRDNGNVKACVMKGGDGSDCPCAKGFSCVRTQTGTGSVCRPLGGHQAPCGKLGDGRCDEENGLYCFRAGGTSIGGGKCVYKVTSGACGGLWPEPADGYSCVNGIVQRAGSNSDICGRTDTPKCADGLNCSLTSTLFGATQKKCTTACSGVNHFQCGESTNFACRVTGSSWGKKELNCVRKLKYENACVSDTAEDQTPCADDLFCSSSLKTCQFRPVRGEPCSTDIPCYGSACRAGRCQ